MRSNRVTTWPVAVIVAVAGMLPLGHLGQAGAQTELEAAVERGRAAWLSHDYEALFVSSDTVRLQLPESGRHQGVTPAHAAQVLKEYLSPADEISFELRRIREASEDHAYAQLARRYVVRGTADERIETVFLGFRRVDGRWRLREVRVTP
jgi:hypothetical protein